MGGDGLIYCIPSSESRVLLCDPASQRTAIFGRVVGRGTSQWCGGAAAASGAVYAAPHDAEEALEISVFVATAWSPPLHAEFPSSTRARVRLLLLCQVKDDAPQGLRSIGRLLVTGVLPFALDPVLLPPRTQQKIAL